MAENITAHMDKSLESLKHNFQGPYRSCQRQHSVRHHRRLLRCPHAGHAGCRRQDPEAHMLLIEPWDKALINAIVKAIGASDLGITPTPTAPSFVFRSRLPLRSAVASSSRSAASTPSRPRCLSVTSVATSTTSSSAMRSSPRTTYVASRPRSRSIPMSMSPRSRSF